MRTTATLWQRFAQMTPQEARAEQALELVRLKAGEMPEDELEERSAAWRRAAQYHMEHAAELTTYLQLRKARAGLRVVK